MSDHKHLLPPVLLSVLFAVVLRGAAEAAPPSPPTNLAVAVQGMSVTLTWARASTGDPATSFLLEAGTFPGGTNVFVGNIGNATVLMASAPAGTYFVRVRAVNAEGTSAPSN